MATSNPVAPVADKAKERPAETTALAVAVGTLIALASGLTDPVAIGALVTVVGATPSVVTWIVNLVRNRS